MDSQQEDAERRPTATAWFGRFFRWRGVEAGAVSLQPSYPSYAHDSSEEDGSQSDGAQRWPGRTGALLLVGGACLALACGSLALFVAPGAFGLGARAPAVKEGNMRLGVDNQRPLVQLAGLPSGAWTCNVGENVWTRRSSVNPAAKIAVQKALMMVEAARRVCEGGRLQPLDCTAADFEKGLNHTHYLHVHHKYASTCDSETFKLHFYVLSTDMSFVVEVARDFATDSWTMLRSSPRPCEIGLGGSATPEAMPKTDEVARRAADFVSSELGFQMRKRRCLGEDAYLEPGEVEWIVGHVTTGLTLNLVMKVEIRAASLLSPIPKVVQATVLERCAEPITALNGGGCVRQLVPPLGVEDVCEMLLEPEAPQLRLRRLQSLGHALPDATELRAELRRELRLGPGEELAPRRLQAGSRAGKRPPAAPRYISLGAVPREFDPRNEACYRNIPVADQGSCGTCYAHALSQTIGIRKCLADRGSKAQGARRLAQPGLADRLPDFNATSADVGGDFLVAVARRRLGVQERKTRKGCPCLQSWSFSGSKCTNFCCNPDKGEADWCFVQDRTCEGLNWGYCQSESTTTASPSVCLDNAAWKDSSARTCGWFTKNDPGCRKYPDAGQRTHCRATCGTCPPTKDDQQGSDTQSTGVLYQYMPSVADIAPCFKGEAAPCSGGNAANTWNSWMRSLDRPLWTTKDACRPYNLKCFESKGVVNPLSGGKCTSYDSLSLWQKPCSCIPVASRPTTVTCPKERPSPGCAAEVPVAFFTITNVANGLSIADAVLNMQRHIQEYGPISVAFAVQACFMHWDWKTNPVYTGQGDRTFLGGHAVMAVGWGAQAGVDYWLLRNSWGSDWADKGYCRFQRGINLDTIEERELGTVMPYAGFKDFSPPICDLMDVDLPFTYQQTTLVTYTVKLKIRCTEAADINVWVSERLNTQEDSFKSHKGRHLLAKALPNTDVEVTQNLLPLNYGLKAGEMWVQITSSDWTTNEGKSSHFVTVPAVPNMNKVKS